MAAPTAAERLVPAGNATVAQADFVGLRSQVGHLGAELAKTRRELQQVRDELAVFKDALSVETVVLRELPSEQLAQEIRELMADGQTRYEDDIADALQVDIVAVLRALGDLEATGEIETP